MPTCTIGNAQGFWGDQADAPARLLEQFPKLDYLTLDYLAEVSLSILALQRHRDADLGYARDFIEVVRSLAPHWHAGHPVRVVCNAGGLNPVACAQAAIAALQAAGLGHKRVAVVTGDDVLPVLKAYPRETLFRHLESKRPLVDVAHCLFTANAYIGASGIAQALDLGADIVISGRAADPSLAVGICVHAFGWRLDDYPRLAAATVAGHLLECGAQATGGIATDWLDLPDPAHIGYPVIEMTEDGAFSLTKGPGTGGEVSLRTVKEQLLYELGDPAHYLSPDCEVDFTSLRLSEEGPDRVWVSGCTGGPPPPTYKVSATCRDGFSASGMLTIFGRDAVAKARRCGEIIFKRLRQAGHTYARQQVELLGANAAALGILETPALMETVLRVSVADPNYEAVERFTREIAPLITTGPQGTTGYASGRPRVQPVFAYWPCLIERGRVNIEARLVAPPPPREGEAPAEPAHPREGEAPAEPVHSEPHPRAHPHVRPPGMPIRLGDIAHARSGDKGGGANIGVIAHTEAGYHFLVENLSAERVADFFAPMQPGAVVRHELPNLGALNFLLSTVLDGGGSRNLRIDAQGKALGQILLEMPISMGETPLDACLPR